MSNDKVRETWQRLNKIDDKIDDLIRVHKESINALEAEYDEIYHKCETNTTELVLSLLDNETNVDLRDIIKSLRNGVSEPFSQLHELTTDEQWKRWHDLQEKVSETTGMYYDSGASQSFFIVKIWQRLTAELANVEGGNDE